MNKNKYIFNVKECYCKVYYKDSYGLIDIEDYNKVKDYNWHIDRSINGYLITDTYINNKKESMYLHRFIMSDKLKGDNKLVIDHINRNRLDNRKINLRACTQQQNMFNKGIMDKNQYGVTGISKVNGRYQSSITIDGKFINLGYFDNVKDAVMERLKAEVVYYKEYAPQKHLFEEYGIDSNIDYNVHKYVGRKDGNEKKVKGIHKYKYRTSQGKYNSKWRVEFSIKGKKYYLGLFDKLDEAIEIKENWYKLHVKDGIVIGV